MSAQKASIATSARKSKNLKKVNRRKYTFDKRTGVGTFIGKTPEEDPDLNRENFYEGIVPVSTEDAGASLEKRIAELKHVKKIPKSLTPEQKHTLGLGINSAAIKLGINRTDFKEILKKYGFKEFKEHYEKMLNYTGIGEFIIYLKSYNWDKVDKKEPVTQIKILEAANAFKEMLEAGMQESAEIKDISKIWNSPSEEDMETLKAFDNERASGSTMSSVDAEQVEVDMNKVESGKNLSQFNFQAEVCGQGKGATSVIDVDSFNQEKMMDTFCPDIKPSHKLELTGDGNLVKTELKTGHKETVAKIPASHGENPSESDVNTFREIMGPAIGLDPYFSVEVNRSLLRSRIERARQMLSDISNGEGLVSCFEKAGITDDEAGMRLLDAPTTAIEDIVDILQKCSGLPLLRLKMAAALIREKSSEGNTEIKAPNTKAIIQNLRPIKQMQDRELLETYQDTRNYEAEQELHHRAKYRPFVILCNTEKDHVTGKEAIDIENSLVLLKAARREETPRTVLLDNENYIVYRITDLNFENRYIDLCPLCMESLYKHYCGACKEDFSVIGDAERVYMCVAYHKNAIGTHDFSEGFKEDVDPSFLLEVAKKGIEDLRGTWPSVVSYYDALKKSNLLPKLRIIRRLISHM